MNVIYFDMIEVGDDIKSFVNISRFGDLFYKKRTLFEHSKKIFEENRINTLYRITNKTELKSLLEKITYSTMDDFLFISSNMVIVNPEPFADFLKKIKFIESALAVCDCECIKPLFKMRYKDMVKFLGQLVSTEYRLYDVLSLNAEGIEKFNKENFYHEINSYSDFVTYLQSSFELRFFNSIHNFGNSITKRSSLKEKMKKEYGFYSILPEEMKLYFLPPFNYKEYENYAEYSLEKLHVLDVSIQWIHFSLNTKEFSLLLNRLFEFIKQRKTITLSKDKRLFSTRLLYEEKVSSRISEFKNTMVFDSIESLIRVSTRYNSIDEVIKVYFKLYKSISDSSDNFPEALSHGDLCFSNILYDKRISLLKLIDPRGCIEEEEGYLNYYYDIAKLSHSILGNYDFINSGIFEIKYDDQLRASLEIPDYAGLNEYKSIFINLLASNGLSYRKVRLYEASLFLSMLPLHIDFPKKVVAFILTAISILEELENEKLY